MTDWTKIPLADRPHCSTPETHRLVESFQGKHRRLKICGDCGWPRRRGEDPRIGQASQRFNGLSFCHRCLTTWGFVDHHCTQTKRDGSGMFPLCELCWRELKPVERVPFYRIVFDSWRREAAHYGYASYGDKDWQEIERAVLNEDESGHVGLWERGE